MNCCSITLSALGDVLQRHHDGVCSEEGLGQRDPPVGGVVQGALHPLDGLGVEVIIIIILIIIIIITWVLRLLATRVMR